MKFMGQLQPGDRSFNTRLLGILKAIRQNTIIKRISIDKEGGKKEVPGLNFGAF